MADYQSGILGGFLLGRIEYHNVLGGFINADRLVPKLIFHEWNVNEASPTGTRNNAGGHAAFIKVLDDSSAGAMEFDDIIIDYTTPEEVSKVQCFTCHVSGIQYGVSNLRFWAPTVTALAAGGNLEYAASGTWVQNAVLPSGNGLAVPTTLPTLPNIRNQDGQSYTISWTDEGSSEYIYMAISVPSGMPLGQYGNGVNGNLVFRLTYDWYSI